MGLTTRSPATLDLAHRRATLERLRAERFDVVVVGGGVTGCGAALDAATRGLSVALIEMRDYAAGTSSRSGKLVHGGLRYLAHLELHLVRESLSERALLLERLCPHLVKPMRFMYLLERPFLDRPYIGAGMALYDTIGGAGAVPRHRHLSKRGALRLVPALRPDALAGAITYYDTQADDARHTLNVVRTAAAYGARVATGVRAIGYEREGDRIAGVRVRDAESGDEFAIAARAVINAAGVWTDALQEVAGGHGGFRVRASKGVHLLVPRERIEAGAAFVYRAEREPQLFARPWGRFWMIGTTDTPWDLDLDHPVANREDIDYLLRNTNRVLRTPLRRADVVGAFAGLRPLVEGETDATSRISREHAVAAPAPGLTVIAGGKYTTYRVMAKDAVDAAAAQALGGDVPASCTEEVALLGADGYRARWNARARTAREAGLPVGRVEHLLNRYGSLIDELLVLVAGRPQLGEPIPGAEEYLRVEALYAATHEGALHLDDVLVRRLHVAMEERDRGLRAAAAVAPLVAEALGWDDPAIARELERFRARVEAEAEAVQQPDDGAASAARLHSRDPRLVGSPG